MSNKVRLGILGLGNMGSSHATKMHAGECPEITLSAVCDIKPERLEWAKENNEELYNLFSQNKEYAEGILSIDRGGNKPRKDISKWSDIKPYVEYFYDEIYTPDYTMPENISADDAKAILETYKNTYNSADEKDMWFSRIKDMCEGLGFTPNVKEYKKNPDAFKGHVGDVSTVIRIAVTSRRNTPDLYSIMQLLGEEKVMDRLNRCIESL